ncbi:MAG TPA: serine hydrolase, partial [Flavobacteriales bacterium]|nr:serine hydrolase [Flavobacteriales bacterium]
TSGIQSFTDMKDYGDRMALDLTPAEMVDHFKNEPMHFDPGTRFEYNNSGYFLLAWIIEKASGKTYREYLEENFFKPLGMSNSYYGSNVRLIPNRTGTYSKSETGFENATHISMTQPYGAGSIMSTVEDLYTWNAALHAGNVIKKETLLKAHTSYKLSDGTETGYGYGWSMGVVQGSPTLEHGGGINGTVTMGIYLPNEDVFVAVFANCDCQDPGMTAAKMAAHAIGKPYAFSKILLPNLKEYTGVYENAKGEQRVITVKENKLYSQRNKGRVFEITPYEKDKFFFDDNITTMHFARNAKKKIDKLTLNNREPSQTWFKTNKPIPAETPVKKLDEKLLETYVGSYEMSSEFSFVITREADKLFAQATGQQKLEIFAETDNKFFIKEVDAQLEFIKENEKITKVILHQNGQHVEAKRVD